MLVSDVHVSAAVIHIHTVFTCAFASALKTDGIHPAVNFCDIFSVYIRRLRVCTPRKLTF
jgi:hypothetical protein